MNFELEDFQETAAAKLVKQFRTAQGEYDSDGELTAIGLTAPTGAGKTVIATSMLERLLTGDLDNGPDDDLRVLWVTDDPSLNQQTIAKITQASDQLDYHHIRFLQEIDERTLGGGFIYFVHIQAMQKNSTMHAYKNGVRSDLRTHGVWEMIANTVADHGSNLLVVVDEAHRGTKSTKDRGTIVGTIIGGGTTNIGTPHPAAPIVLGISATPERFLQSVGSRDSVKQHQVPAAEVRASGLLKDRILVKHIAEDQAADHTMLELAVHDLEASREAWRVHHEATGDRRVDPLLVVQVEPAVTATRLSEILTTLEQTSPELKGLAVAHAFGDPHGPLQVGDRVVRYLAPEAIEGDDAARVVLFKSALTTGWDCPRAEVLISFQNKESYTEIAQLIGRLVRTPLARRVDGDDLLNSVVAFLPGFNSEHVIKVVNALTSDETVDVDIVIEAVDCIRDPTLPATVDEAIIALPSFARPPVTHATRTSQLMRLASQLVEHGIVSGASKAARQWIVSDLVKHDGLRSAEVDARAIDVLTVDVDTVTVEYGTSSSDTTHTSIPTSDHDLDTYYGRAQKVLPDGAAGWYLAHLRTVEEDVLTDREAKARVAALAALDFADVVEEAATDLIETWRNTHAADVAHLSAAARAQIEPLWVLRPDDMVSSPIVLPAIRREASQRAEGSTLVPIDLFSKHLYVIGSGSAAGQFPTKTTSWERGVLDVELGRPSLLAWYRNPDSGRSALAIPYRYGSDINLLHPDFLFLHDDSGQVVVDIVDPHFHTDGATAEKWAALARYAQANSDLVRHVTAVIENADGALRGLDLTANGIDDVLEQAGDGGKIAELFTQAGFDFL